MFGKLFKKISNLDKISKSVNDHKKKVDSLIKEIKFGRTFKENYNEVLFDLCEYMKMHVWKKDKDFLYEFSNDYHCVNFLGLDSDCINKIAGLSDKDVMKIRKSKISKVLCEVSILTDKVVKEEKKECDFIEGDFKKKVLVVKKIPIFENDKFIGITGTAQEYKDKNILSNYLDKMIKRNSAKCIYGTLDKDFCYQISNSSIQKNLFTFMVDRRKKII